jgi:hypothetical protein
MLNKKGRFMQKLSLATGILILSLSASALAQPNIGGSPVDVHFYVGSGSQDQSMTVTFNAAGTLNCSSVNPGPGVCQNVVWSSTGNPPLKPNTPLPVTFGKNVDFVPGFGMTSGSLDPNPTGTLNITFGVSMGNNTVNNVTASFPVVEGALPASEYFPQFISTTNLACDLLETPPATSGGHSSLTISCVDS